MTRALAGHVEPIPVDLLTGVGEALYGDDWTGPMARDLGVNRRTVLRWKRAERRIPATIAQDLINLLQGQRTDICRAIRGLRRYVCD